MYQGFRFHPIVFALALALPMPMASGNPSGLQVVNGQVQLSQQNATLVIRTTPNAILNWQQFSIAQGETTQFVQQSASSAVLNRVVGVNPSQILGQLASNGHVFLINPNGLMVGKGAQIDTAGFVASTLDIRNDDFLAGRYVFAGSGGTIDNEGRIHSPNGDIWLIAPNILNGGVIQADNGNLILAAGHSVQIASADLEGVTFTLQAPADQAVNLGTLQGNGVGIFAAQLRHAGVIEANAVNQVGGKVILQAASSLQTDAGSQIHADGPQGGQITLDAGAAGTLLAAGQMTALGNMQQGGQIQLLGQQVGLIGQASVDASGQRGGGTVLVGGYLHGSNVAVPDATNTYVGADTVIHADAGNTGDGGKVVVWGNNYTQFYGQITARGGATAGDGGMVETSGKQNLLVTGSVDAAAPKGKPGNWLMDPYNITIGNCGDFCDSGWDYSSYTFSPTRNNSQADVYTITNALAAGTSVTVATGKSGSAGTQAGNITVVSTISATSSGTATAPTLTLDAANNIVVQNSITSNGSPGFNVALQAGNEIDLSNSSASINVGTNTVKLVAGSGGITNGSSGGTITAGSLEMQSSGAVTLNGANSIGTVAAKISGSGNGLTLAVQNTNDLTIGTAGSTSGISAAGNIVLQLDQSGSSNPNLQINQGISSSAGDVTLKVASGTGSIIGAAGQNVQGGNVTFKTTGTGSAINVHGKVTADALTITTSGSATLDQAGNQIGSVGGNVGGNLVLDNARSLTINQINVTGTMDVENTAALTVAGAIDASAVKLVSTGALTINATVQGYKGDVDLQTNDSGGSQDNIVQNQQITAGGDINIYADDDFHQNANLLAGSPGSAPTISLQRAKVALSNTATNGNISVDATNIYVASNAYAESGHPPPGSGKITYGSSRTRINQMLPSHMLTNGAKDLYGSDLLYQTITTTVVNQMIPVQSTVFQQISSGLLPYGVQFVSGMPAAPIPIRVEDSSDAECAR